MCPLSQSESIEIRMAADATPDDNLVGVLFLRFCRSQALRLKPLNVHFYSYGAAFKR
jgi:hypothetical protein